MLIAPRPPDQFDKTAISNSDEFFRTKNERRWKFPPPLILLQLRVLICAIKRALVLRYLPFLIVIFFDVCPVKPPPSVTVSVTVME